MTLQYKICLFAVKLFEDHGIQVDRAELLSLSIYTVPKEDKGLFKEANVY